MRNPKYKQKAKNSLSLPVKGVLMGVQGAESYSLPPPFSVKFQLYSAGMTENGGPCNRLLKINFSFNIAPRGVAVKGFYIGPLGATEFKRWNDTHDIFPI